MGAFYMQDDQKPIDPVQPETTNDTLIPPPDDIDSLNVQTVDTPPKKRLSKRTIILLSILVAALVAGGIVTYLLLTKNDSQNTASNTDSSNIVAPTPAPEKLTAEALVAKAKAVATGDKKETLQNTDSQPYNVFRAPAFKPAGYDFWVSPSVDYGFGSYGMKDTITTDLAAIKKVLVDNKLTEKVLDQGSAEGMFAAEYSSDDITCILTDQKPYQQPATSKEFNTILGCADTSAYLANAVELKPYFTAYAAQSQSDTTKTAMGGLRTTKSKTAGYSISTVSIGGSEYGSVGGFAGLFYTTPDNKLHFFIGTQSQIPCTDFKTDDLKKAYLGESCFDEKDEAATVKM